MINKNNEIIKHLNRLANDRTLPLQARKKISEAAHYIDDLHDGVDHVRELYMELKNSKVDLLT